MTEAVLAIEPEISEATLTVLKRRYLQKDKRGRVVETPGQMFMRVASYIAAAEKAHGNDPGVYRDLFYGIMARLEFLPNSPTLMNAGTDLGQLAACFVLPVEDSISGIFETVKNAALIHKSGGGTGFSFSRLRPKDSRVGSTGGVASGPVSFMKIFNVATEQVKQGGTRRGANMAVLRVDHPDIMEFILCKQASADLNNFNISVGVTDEFMVKARTGLPYNLVDPRDGRVVGTLNATDVFEAMVKQAWHNGDPGIIFLDRINQDNPTPLLGEIESTNPCGEQPLLPMEACNLGSVNLAKFVVEKKGKPTIDYASLGKTIALAVRFLDDTIDRSIYPLDEITAMVRGNRKIGLGVMGFADLLFALELPYNSDRAVALAEEVMAFVQSEARKASRALAQERGVFENFDKSVFRNDKDRRFRNATVTTIAPTGTLSIIAGSSSGIEPLFALSFIRTIMDNETFLEVNPHFMAVAQAQGFYSEALMEKIAKTGTIKGMTEIPESVRKVFVTAHDVSPAWHVKMQAAFQKHTDNAVSKTVNLPRDATEHDVAEIYTSAFDFGCKGVTIYRDGSKANQVLSISGATAPQDRFSKSVRQRPETLEGFTTRMKTGMGQLYVTVTELDGRPFEVFATIGKSGKSTTAKTEAIGRLISLALRAGVDVRDIIDQVAGIGGEHAVFQEGGRVLSIPDAIGRVLEKRYGRNGKKKVNNTLTEDLCPECGHVISHEEGCVTCHSCGYTRCG
ncbi:NrdA [Desulforapulum autotrophicum HRM2]|uniref:Vitamin B12-dependent ribonucleotide reductase n=1 Tax=Desulforapulum autotrophicum (strain ATCC 43914 / DSM 3382 / VKM B-1955 / HRM2) TaxID=177437 RepID=C0QGE5_DESAH|nr:vitamin B12-dependent ribonucleotide reductase [Desulforapulum autotrophicum]ACN17724.1 NrdA [Desulforapulum autotrophicum HRM2]